MALTPENLKEEAVRRFAQGEISYEGYEEMKAIQPPITPLHAPSPNRYTTPEELMRERMPKQDELGALVGPRPDGTVATYEDLSGMLLVDDLLPKRPHAQVKAELLNRWGFSAKPPSYREILDSGGVRVLGFSLHSKQAIG